MNIIWVALLRASSLNLKRDFPGSASSSSWWMTLSSRLPAKCAMRFGTRKLPLYPKRVILATPRLRNVVLHETTSLLQPCLSTSASSL